ncbi:M23 family metallopeptidase [Mucilaginibacter paludis]|uniref:Peptidase M23 n=1 Tax=Mucilaginibacter paludis DSM 18603 TaxID=714943 RepID=H1YBU3_9SPHI|nr:M23 family metallopeptidase [Mucilaginibacter paludis]EHQ26056.1 Peptidase M23 [Mucilaginibacter paludis DSM 18603]
MSSNTIYIFILFCLSCTTVAAQNNELKADCIRFNQLNTAIRDGKIKKPEAKTQFQNLMIALKAHSNQINDTNEWVFPVQGYNYRAAGGIAGNGYADRSYTYFDGNKHLAHPAHDLFITDRNQDCIDDKTHQPVNILAVADGVVIACSNEWEINSTLRGGRYIWIYHPRQNILTYYAHNRELFVTPGDVVKKGDKIAEMGRTGYNAYKKRSPTHLHFSAYHLIDNLPVAYNCYADLVKTYKR